MTEYILIVLILISIQLFYLMMCPNYGMEGMTNENAEAILNVASLYNNGKMTVDNLNVTGELTTNTINPYNEEDWIRINQKGGKTAVYGNLSVSETVKESDGLSIGLFSPKTGNGKMRVNYIDSHDPSWLRVGWTRPTGNLAVLGNLSVAGQHTAESGSGLTVGAHDKNTVHGGVMTNSIESIHETDWLRIRPKGGKTAVFGNLSVNDKVKEQAGLAVGVWGSGSEPGESNSPGHVGQISMGKQWRIGERPHPSPGHEHRNHLSFTHHWPGVRMHANLMSPDGGVSVQNNTYWTLP